ncbi:hypothetical protein LXL04_024947 [Taraxacum kok-saghyz]
MVKQYGHRAKTANKSGSGKVTHERFFYRYYFTFLNRHLENPIDASISVTTEMTSSMLLNRLLPLFLNLKNDSLPLNSQKRKSKTKIDFLSSTLPQFRSSAAILPFSLSIHSTESSWLLLACCSPAPLLGCLLSAILLSEIGIWHLAVGF